MPVEHRRNKNHRDPRGDQRSHQPMLFHEKYCKSGWNCYPA
jgi:hypothetical protein